jgi:hypothetical protein
MAAGYPNLHIIYDIISSYHIDRICPGMFMANRSLFTIFSSILSTFDIFPPLDEFGNPVKLQATMSPGVLS